MRWINSPVIVFYHFSFFKTKATRVKIHGIIIVDLNMQTHFIHICQFTVLVFLEIIKDGLNKLSSNISTTVGSQNTKCHDVKALLFCTIFQLVILYSSTGSTNDKTIPISKLAETFILSFYNILVILFLVLYGEACQINFSQLYK